MGVTFRIAVVDVHIGEMTLTFRCPPGLEALLSFEGLNLLHRDLELVRDPGVGSALANPCSDAVQLGAQ